MKARQTRHADQNLETNAVEFSRHDTKWLFYCVMVFDVSHSFNIRTASGSAFTDHDLVGITKGCAALAVGKLRLLKNAPFSARISALNFAA
jgi:hypothetical protein